MKFIRQLRDVIRFMHLPKQQHKLTFYSEGKNYWPHLEGLVKEILANHNTPVCYISSGDDDPGLALKHPNYQTFKIDEGAIRNWLFENIETDVVVMTTPDLHQYQLKRSKHQVHYVYVQHSLVSLHMVYRKGAFDHYDTIFCAGPHHIKEVRATEKKYNLPAKNLVEHGYGRLDTILEEVKKRATYLMSANSPKHVLVAPSWGPEALIESGIGGQIVDQLIAEGYRVTLRPHPQTVKFAKDKIDALLRQYNDNSLFHYEADVVGQDTLHISDIMISDWSGAALDYAYGLKKPVLFVDVPRKVNNPDYEELQIEPFESYIRSELGAVVTADDLSFSLKNTLTGSIDIDPGRNVFNLGRSAEAGANYIRQLLKENQ